MVLVPLLQSTSNLSAMIPLGRQCCDIDCHLVVFGKIYVSFYRKNLCVIISAKTYSFLYWKKLCVLLLEKSMRSSIVKDVSTYIGMTPAVSDCINGFHHTVAMFNLILLFLIWLGDLLYYVISLNVLFLFLFIKVLAWLAIFPD